MKIKSLRIKNFQSFEDLYLELDPHLNCIVGPSNVGKSAIIRALDFLFYDEWDPSYVRVNSDFVLIEATLEDGTTIVREKGPGVNRVRIRYPDGKTKTFESFGFDLPKEVKLILGNARLEIDGVEVKVNVSNQEDPHFLISYSPQLRSRLICLVSGLDILERALDLASDEKSSLTKRLKELESEKSRVESQLAELSDLPLRKSEIQRKEELLQVAKEKLELLEGLLSLRDRILSLRREIDELRKRDYSKVDSIERTLDTLENLLLLRDKIESLLRRKSMLEREKMLKEEELASRKKEFVETLREYKICPICDSPLSEEQISRLVSSI